MLFDSSYCKSIACRVTDPAVAAFWRTEWQSWNDCFLYVDEFQNFATDSFATILSEARKYRLNLTIANQYLEQLEDDAVLAAVFGNVGTLLSFQVGRRDAETLAEQFGGYVSTRDMIQLPKYHAYVRMLIDGASRPFSLTTLPPIGTFADRTEIVRQQSRQRYAQVASVVDREIRAQFAVTA